MGKVTKADLILAAEGLNPAVEAMPRHQVEAVVEAFLRAITESLRVKQRVELRGFGSFRVRPVPPRIRRNPRTGEPVEVPASYSVKFKAGNLLQEAADTGLDEID